MTILHFNDVHSRFEELARVASAVDKMRHENTLIFDAGDNADFSRMETEGTQGVISSDILNRIGVHARALGNNEGFAGRGNLEILCERSLCPVLACNIYTLQGRKLSFAKDAVITECSEIRVLIVGVTAGGWLNTFYELFKLNVKEPEQEIKRVLESHCESAYDLLILLSHLGVEEDKKMAQCFPSIDIIVGGHSHTPIEEPLVENGVIIVQAGKFAEYLGELVIDFDLKEKKIDNFRGRLIPSKNYRQMPDIVKMIKASSKVADKNLSKPLFTIPITVGHSLIKENAVGNLLADALKDITKTEIGLINSGVITEGISKGNVTRKMILQLCPSPLNPTYMEVKGADLLAALEKSLKDKYQLGDGRGPGSRTRYLGNLQVSSNVRIETGSSRILSITVDGNPLDLNKWYSIGTSDFLQRGTGYSELAHNRNERYRPEFLRDILQTYIQKESFMKKATNKRFVTKNDARRRSSGD